MARRAGTSSCKQNWWDAETSISWGWVDILQRSRRRHNCTSSSSTSYCGRKNDQCNLDDCLLSTKMNDKMIISDTVPCCFAPPEVCARP
jgi:hypothetical protein